VPGASAQAGASRTEHSLLTTNYEPKSPSRCGGDDPFGRFGRSFDGYVEDEAVKGAQIPKLSAGNDDTAIVVATFCCATVPSRPRRPPIQEEDPPFARWRDYDPSRIALLHGNGDFGQHAWRDHAELPDSAA